MLDADTAVVGVLSLIVAGVLRRTLLSVALDQFFAVDTGSWHWATVVVWNLLPTVALALVIFASVMGLIKNLE